MGRVEMSVERWLVTISIGIVITGCGGGGNVAGGSTSAQPTPGWSILAGSIAEAGAVDGPGATARFNNPQGLAIDAAGNLLVTDWGNDTIRKVAPDGTVSTIAGAPGQAGAVDGVGAAARLNQPVGIHVIGSTAYFGDRSSTFRRLGADGAVVTIAGSAGNPGIQDGTGAAARFSQVAIDITADAAGNLYASGDQIIRKITPEGAVSTIAGSYSGFSGSTVDGTGTSARFQNTDGLALLPDGSGMYVSQEPMIAAAHGGNGYSSALRKVTFDGQVSTVATMPLTTAGFLPEPIATDDNGVLYGVGRQVLRLENGAFIPVDVPLGDIPATSFRPGVSPPPGGIVRIGPKTFCVILGSAVAKLVVP